MLLGAIIVLDHNSFAQEGVDKIDTGVTNSGETVDRLETPIPDIDITIDQSIEVKRIMTPERSAKTAIPVWVDQNFRWYGEGKISQSDLLSAINWLVDNNIMFLSQKQAGEFKVLQQENILLKEAAKTGAKGSPTHTGNEENTLCWLWCNWHPPRLPPDVYCLELIPEIDDTCALRYQSTISSVHAIEEQYYAEVMEANKMMLEELNVLEQKSTSNIIDCIFSLDVHCGLYPDPTSSLRVTDDTGDSALNGTSGQPLQGGVLGNLFPPHNLKLAWDSDREGVIKKFEKAIEQADEKRYNAIMKVMKFKAGKALADVVK